MEDKLKFDFSEYYKRVVEWNIKAGKLPAVISKEDLNNQLERVSEEVEEYLDELRRSVEGKEESTAMLKEMIDVFVVVSYNDYLQECYGHEDEDISLDELSKYMIKDYSLYELDKCVYAFNYLSLRLKDERNALVDLLACVKFQSKGVDLEGAVKAVLDNNDLKIYPCLETVQSIVDTHYNLKEYYIDSTVYLGNTYYTVKRKSDNKVMKNPNHTKCDLSSFVITGGEDE